MSVIISSYNYGRYLRGTIESALALDGDDLEVIVVDDGSTDNSREIIKSYSDRVRSVFQSNQGQVASCTAGLRLSRHEIIIFLDSDDLLYPSAAVELRALWKPSIAKVQYVLQAIDGDGKQVHTIFPKYPHGLTPATIRAELLRAGVYPATTTSGTAFARRFLEQVMPIPAQYDCDIDDALNVAAPLHGEVVTLPKVLGCYRVHESNTSAHADLTPTRFERYARDAEERGRYLRDSCERIGVTLPAGILRNDVAYWENQLAAAVLKPESPRLPLLWPAMRAALGSILDPGQRAMHALWAMALATLPRAIARHLLAQRFIFGRRSRFAEGLLHNVWQLGRWTPFLLGRKPIGR